jgi:hypothetical protein
VAHSREIRSGGGGAHILKHQSGHSAHDSPLPGTKKPKPIRCEPRWRAADATLHAAIGKLTDKLEEQERELAPRQRRRRVADAATFRLAIECIACNLVALSLAAPERPLAIPLANSASQIAPIFGKPARKVIDLMVALGLVTKVVGYPFRGPTTIRATRPLRRFLPLGAADWNALDLEDDPKVVVLNTRNDDDEEAVTIASRRQPPAVTQWLEKVTVEMHAINTAIKKAPIECDGSATVHIAERPSKPTASLVTLHHRTLRRTFNGSWEHGGRLFGGFWQTMPRVDRFRHIRIGGEPVALVDYHQLFLRLAYAEANATPQPGDLYQVAAEEASRADWKRLRDARKKLVNALFFRKTPLKQWPGATLEEIVEMRSAFAAGTKPRDAINAIKEKHAAIARWFERGHGFRFLRTESDLITAVTLALFGQGIVALSIHDAVSVPERHAVAAKAVMEREAKRMTGASIPAGIEFASNYGVRT